MGVILNDTRMSLRLGKERRDTFLQLCRMNNINASAVVRNMIDKYIAAYLKSNRSGNELIKIIASGALSEGINIKRKSGDFPIQETVEELPPIPKAEVRNHVQPFTEPSNGITSAPDNSSLSE